MIRSVLRVLLQVVVGTALTFALGVLSTWLISRRSIAEAIDFGFSGVLLFIDIALATWALLLIVGNVRKRGVGWGLGGSILAAVIGAVVNLVWIGILSVVTGGQLDVFAISLGLVNSVYLLIAVAIAALLVLRVIIRPHKT